MRGIPPNVASTMWKAVHNILPTKDRLDKMSNVQRIDKGKFKLYPQAMDNIYHSLTEYRNS